VGNSPTNYTDPSGLLFGGRLNAGERLAEQAQQYWAQRFIDPNKSALDRGFSFGMGLLTSLWTCENSDYTLETLGIALTLDAFLVQPYIAAAMPPWLSWNNYGKVTHGGREYAVVGGRRYTHHAVDRLQPSGLGRPAASVSNNAGRSVAPRYIEDVLSSTLSIRLRSTASQTRH